MYKLNYELIREEEKRNGLRDQFGAFGHWTVAEINESYGYDILKIKYKNLKDKIKHYETNEMIEREEARYSSINIYYYLNSDDVNTINFIKALKAGGLKEINGETVVGVVEIFHCGENQEDTKEISVIVFENKEEEASFIKNYNNKNNNYINFYDISVQLGDQLEEINKDLLKNCNIFNYSVNYDTYGFKINIETKNHNYFYFESDVIYFEEINELIKYGDTEEGHKEIKLVEYAGIIQILNVDGVELVHD